MPPRIGPSDSLRPVSAASQAGSFAERDDALEAFASTLKGRGIEVGPAHQPFDRLPAGCDVRYVDRWPVWVSRAMFPELGWRAPWVRPDIRVDVDRKGMAGVADRSQDFVILGHVVEHVANPLRLISESYRVLAVGGVLLLLAPNRHRTFDQGREPTPLEHVVDEYRSGITKVDDAHVRSFLTHTGELKPGLGQRRQLRYHRRRSVHAHCWDESEFFAVLDYLVQQEGQAWVLDDLFPPHMYDGCHEFGYLLRRIDGGHPDQIAADLAAARERLLAESAPPSEIGAPQ